MVANTGQLSGGISQLAAETGAGDGVTVVAAAGSTQGGATAITGTPTVVRITTTTSAEGVKLPAILTFTATGARQITIVPKATMGVKVYPASGEGIYATATNTAVTIASAKPSTFFAAGSTDVGTALRWLHQKGG